MTNKNPTTSPDRNINIGTHVKIEGTQVLHGDGRLICTCVSPEVAQSVAVGLTFRANAPSRYCREKTYVN